MPGRNFSQLFWLYLIKPRSNAPDAQRREFIVNILICGLSIIAFANLVTSIRHRLIGNTLAHSPSLVVTIAFFLIMVGLWAVSRKGGYRLVSYVFIVFTALTALTLMWQWSFELPAAELLYVLTIVIAGVLLSTRIALLFTAFGSLAVVVLGYLQSQAYLHPRTDWLYNSHIEMGDAVGYATLLAIIGVVSWLSNREIEHSLQRALTSEAALAKERDNLEIKVAERTQELEQLQLARLLELQRFAEFGKFSAGLLHEVANPLTAASLNLQQLTTQEHSTLVKQAQNNLRSLERYVKAARKQLKGESPAQSFSVRGEIQQVLRLLTNAANKAQVKLVFQQTGSYRLFGDPVKFNQLVANLVANAIDAYKGADSTKEHRVVVKVSAEEGRLVLVVSDWGRGIDQADISHLFEPFFTTKPDSQRSLGIGLAMVKQFVEKDFGGQITVTSDATGTHFTAQLRLPSS